MEAETSNTCDVLDTDLQAQRAQVMASAIFPSRNQRSGTVCVTPPANAPSPSPASSAAALLDSSHRQAIAAGVRGSVEYLGRSPTHQPRTHVMPRALLTQYFGMLKDITEDAPPSTGTTQPAHQRERRNGDWRKRADYVPY
jgi:hypothetical protein